MQNQEDGEESGMDFTNVEDMYAVFLDRLEAVDNAAPAAPLHVKHGKGKGNIAVIMHNC